MIKVENLRKSFNGKEILSGVSSSFQKGKTNLIIGASGTGKSVLLKCIVGLVKPDDGRILYDGRDFTNGSPDEITEVRREIGMLFQGAALFDSQNVEQNKKMPSELSGGMKKRVGIARAIVNNSRYLFCDEPNSGLDPQTSILIDNLIKEITEEFEITTVVVTHDMNSVMEIGDTIIFMYKGKKLWEGDNENILEARVEELRQFIFANKLMKKFE
jgi:phospholipid/cholesterol/gamma-HCH transport system ATP-binding protein